MDLEVIVLSEISQTEKDTYCVVSLICRVFKKRNLTKRDQTWLQEAEGREGALEKGGQKVQIFSYEINKY